jgi:hypothetical protein
MRYDCLSVVAERFDDDNRHESDRSIAGFADELARAKSMFRFLLADIRVAQHCHCEPHPAIPLIRELSRCGYQSRLLLAPQILLSGGPMMRLVDEAIGTGASRVILNVDCAQAEYLPSADISSFATICARHGVRSEIRAEFDAEFPESVLAVLDAVESARFYTSTIPVQKRPYTYEPSPPQTFSALSVEKHFRVLISQQGEVCLRERGDIVVDTHIGNLNECSLIDILNQFQSNEERCSRGV